MCFFSCHKRIFALLDGNEEAIFTIERTENNRGLIKNVGRLDREEINQHLLTIKCFKASSRNIQQGRKPYNRLVSILTNIV